MLVTDQFIFKLDCEKFRNMKEGVALQDLTGELFTLEIKHKRN